MMLMLPDTAKHKSRQRRWPVRQSGCMPGHSKSMSFQARQPVSSPEADQVKLCIFEANLTAQSSNDIQDMDSKLFKQDRIAD